MKILYVINSGLVGGLQRHVLTLMRALDGVAETAVAINAIFDSKVISIFEEEGFRVYRLNCASGHDMRVVGRFYRVLKDFNPDVIHAHDMPILVSLALRFGTYGHRGRVPVLHSLHCPTGCPNWKMRLVMNIFDRHVIDYWLPVSGPTWDDFKKSYLWAKGEVFFNPLILSDFKPKNDVYSSPKQSFIVGMVGRNADQKDWPSFHTVEALVQKYFQPPKSKVQSPKSKVQPPKSKVQPPKSIYFLNAGEKSVCDGRAAIRSMDLFVMTSKHEQLPTTVLECFALGTPICGFLPDGGTSDIIQFSNGPVREAFIRERSCEKLADLVVDLIGNPEKRRALVEDGRRILEEHFDAVKNCRGDLMRIYNSLGRK